MSKKLQYKIDQDFLAIQCMLFPRQVDCKNKNNNWKQNLKIENKTSKIENKLQKLETKLKNLETKF